MVDKIFYNEASAAKLGWTPEWFGAYEFNEDLLKKIRNFQRNHSLKVDGLCGPATFRRIHTVREAQLESYHRKEIRTGSSNHIIYNNEYYPIEWDKVVLPFNANGLKITKGYNCFFLLFSIFDFKHSFKDFAVLIFHIKSLKVSSIFLKLIYTI